MSVGSDTTTPSSFIYLFEVNKSSNLNTEDIQNLMVQEGGAELVALVAIRNTHENEKIIDELRSCGSDGNDGGLLIKFSEVFAYLFSFFYRFHFHPGLRFIRFIYLYPCRSLTTWDCGV
jgi:hypothetical protein